MGGNASAMLRASVQWSPQRLAVIDGDQVVTYDRLAARAGAFAEAITAAGAGPGSRVAVLLRRDADAAAAFFGVLATGAIAVMVSDQLRHRQIEHILKHSGAQALIASGQLLDRLPSALETDVPILDPRDIAMEARFEPVRRLQGDAAQIVYTSGSTGRPKGVTLSHGNLRAGVDSVVSYLGIRGDDRIASLLPFNFDYGLNQLLCAVATGATLVVERSPVPARIAHTLAAQEVSVLACVPPLWLQLLDSARFQEPLAVRIMTNTGGRLPTSAVKLLREYQPQAKLFLMYGLTEAFRSTYLAPDKAAAKPDSIGQAIPGAEVLVIDEHGRECLPGMTGELVHRGPTVALGYWNDPEATTRRYRPHPLHPEGTPAAERVVYSGDLVRRDEDGDLFFVGREDSMIKTLGYRVSPDEITDVLYSSGEVAEVVVTSEPDEIRGERIVAWVALRRNGSLDRLQTFSAQELPRYLQPSRFEVVERLERTASGKYDARATAGRVR
jgi:amino acid adenylation domain-containing protein